MKNAPMSMSAQTIVVQQLRAIATLVRAVEPEPLQQFIEARQHASTIGPLLQPTAWLGPDAFATDRAWVDLAQALLYFRKEVMAAAAVIGGDR